MIYKVNIRQGYMETVLSFLDWLILSVWKLQNENLKKRNPCDSLKMMIESPEQLAEYKAGQESQ